VWFLIEPKTAKYIFPHCGMKLLMGFNRTYIGGNPDILFELWPVWRRRTVNKYNKEIWEVCFSYDSVFESDIF